MKRIEDTFSALRVAKRKALVAYLCVGDPSPDESVDLALACVAAGADILELGVPFSDPSADGPAIERASVRAIRAGGGIEASLEVARRVREKTEVPIVLFGYYNPLFVRGERRSVDDAKAAGVDALLVVDLPMDVSCVLRSRAHEVGLRVIPLATPTTKSERLEIIRREKAHAGFVYYVSVAGITGSAGAPLEEATRAAGKISRDLGIPTVVGFGIDSSEKAAIAGREADGVVVGTAIVKAIEGAKTAPERKAAVAALVGSLRQALDAL